MHTAQLFLLKFNAVLGVIETDCKFVIGLSSVDGHMNGAL